MLRPTFVAAALAVSLAGCALVRLGERLGPCDPREYSTLVVSLSPIELVPGESHSLARPVLVNGPYGATPLHPDCGVRWEVVGGGGAIDAAGKLTVAADAAPGSTVTVRAYAAARSAEHRVAVVDPAPNPLAGTWREREGGPYCVGGGEPLRELVFRRSGEWTATRRPFESYVDGGGRYTYDRATGRLSLVASTGNPVAEGRAYVEGGELVLEGIELYGSMSPEPCRARFSY